MSNIKIAEIGRLDFNLAITFLAIWQERSVSRAALRLSLSQSAVSAALARLRVATNDPLFIRTRGGMEPTARAISMAGQIQHGVELLRQALVVEDRFDPATSTRHFSLGMSDDFEVALGPAIAARLLALAPNVSVVFRQANRHIVEQMLEAREIDLAIASGVPARSWLVTEDLGHSGYASLLNNKLCGLPLPLSLEDFLGLPHILISFLGREGIVDSGLKAIGRSRTIHTALTHFSSLPSYLMEMRVIASVPSHAARALAANTALDISPVPLALGTYMVSMLHRRDVAEDAAIHWIKGIIRQAFAVSVPQPET
ncbi:LysR family transcriptional regulator [Rhizobium sp. KVB221]|uniref:LysR family transcriptional regulator n=1 Tax=Rhizobium setariae TaxID=2801340 RepID=A0A937CMB3_9HYPH|nr:LysR substrate-binding domain-containing protein [Rhizobium setariae]MBL0370734.1 LysR family transcriptional regulator [Rhizobium setariae]